MTMPHSDSIHAVTSADGNNAAGYAPDPLRESLQECRREAFLAAARGVFTTAGYHGARMDAISARAGLSKPVLYSEFPGKLDLYIAVLQQYLDKMVAGVRRGVAVDAGYGERVRRAVMAYFDFADEDEGGHVLVFETPVPSEPVIAWRVSCAMRECATLVSDQLRGAGVDPARADMCASGLVGASHLAARDWLDAGRPIPKADAVDTVVALCWSGLSSIDRLGPPR
ncbi:TetR/AcrR family transcriptional regulator [Nocardia sp. NPDC055029]